MYFLSNYTFLSIAFPNKLAHLGYLLHQNAGELFLSTENCRVNARVFI